MNSSTGRVYLVGAGPGDPGLLSLRGRECLALADVVLYDGLVNPLILQHTSAECQRTSRMKGPDGNRIPQEEINRRLVKDAQRGLTVVRLKGGDPFVFGRGSEEAAALKAAEIPFEIVPGVTAAVAAAEYAGISVTHRDHASAVAFITGHEDPRKPGSTLDYRILARFPGTLVFYMGLHRLPQIVDSLLREGLSPETPACVISHGTLYSQRTVSGEIRRLPTLVTAAKLTAPSLIVVGDCVLMREQLQWFEQKPLFGQRIAITRPLAQAYETVKLAEQFGIVPLLIPTIRIEPPDSWDDVDRSIEELEDWDWLIFTSRNGVSFFFDRLLDRGYDLRRVGGAKIAAIGAVTADALRDYHLQADVVPDTYRAEALASELKARVVDQRVLWCGANRGREVLIDELSPLCREFQKLIVYRNTDIDALEDSVAETLSEGELDWLALSSPSIARSIAALLPEEAKSHLGTQIKVAAISPVTADAAQEIGLPVNTIAKTHTWQGIFEGILEANSD